MNTATFRFELAAVGAPVTGPVRRSGGWLVAEIRAGNRDHGVAHKAGAWRMLCDRTGHTFASAAELVNALRADEARKHGICPM